MYIHPGLRSRLFRLTRCHRILPFLFSGLLLAATLPLQAQESTGWPRDNDIQTLQAAGIPLTGAGLLQFFQEQLPTAAEQQHIEQLARLLGHSSYRLRVRAQAQLLEQGPKALAQLRQLRTQSDLEAAVRAQHCMDAVAAHARPELHMAALRQLQVIRPEAAAEVLFAYLPFAVDDTFYLALLEFVYDLEAQRGEPHSVLVIGLADGDVLRRSTAALIVGRWGNADQQHEVRKLLNDADALVRFRAAQGLLAAQDESGLATLVELLHTGPADLAEHSQEVLRLVAGMHGPRETLALDRASRNRCAQAWRRWLTARTQLDVARLDKLLPFYSEENLAGQVARHFAQNLVGLNYPRLEKTIAVPFYAGNGHFVLDTHTQFAEYIRDTSESVARNKIEIRTGAIAGPAYLKQASREEQQLLQKLAPTELYIFPVVVRNLRDGTAQDGAALLVRVRQGEARVIGTLFREN